MWNDRTGAFRLALRRRDRTPWDRRLQDVKIASTLNSASAPTLSIIIAVYNDWVQVCHCLRSLDRQENCAAFEVIVVDDGSDEAAPQYIRNWNDHFPLTIVRQQHAGIAAARNRGIQSARGTVLVFTDSDCEVQRHCFSALQSAIASFPQHNCFQLRMVGDLSNLIGRAEELRLMSIQEHALQPSGCIRYLNTAGFAIRKSSINPDSQLFDPLALRGEDTFLLAELILREELPLFVPDARVQHAIRLSLTRCLLKEMRSAWLEGNTYERIGARGVRVRMAEIARIKMMVSMWAAASHPSIGRMAWAVVVTRRAIHRFGSLVYKSARKIDRLVSSITTSQNL